MKKKFSCLFLIFVFAAGILAFSGCKTRLMDFTLLSSKNVDLSHAGRFKKLPDRIEGEDVPYWCYVFPIGGFPNLKTAVDRAIQKIPGCVALVDGVVYQYQTGCIPFIWKNGWIVEGSPLVDPKHAKNFPSHYMIISYNEKINDYELKFVTKQEFEDMKNYMSKL
jgi:hypothetical protein